MIQIIDYGSGNLESIKCALNRLSTPHIVIKSPNEIRPGHKLIFSGVGAAGSAMSHLKQSGFAGELTKLQQPFLGICLGMQLLFERSEENATQTLGIIKGDVRKFPLGLTVPQMGWNQVTTIKDSPLFDGIPQHSNFYFVNSYYAKPLHSCTIAESEYNITFCCAIQMNQFYGVQFHPEKSGEMGHKLLNNFVTLC